MVYGMIKELICNDEARVPPLAYALLVLLLIIIIATVVPAVKQTIIDILSVN